MSLAAVNPAEDGGKDAQDQVVRWITDADGRALYYPYGPRRAGYLLTDAAREPALRAADARYQGIGKRIKPYSYILVLPLIYTFYYLFGTHPILAFASFPAFLAAAALIDRVLFRSIVGNLIEGLPQVAPLKPLPAPVRSLRNAAAFLLVFAGAVWLVLYVYDLRVDAVAANRGGTTEFYPDISFYVLFTLVFAACAWVIFAGWKRVAAKFSPNRALLSAFLFIVLTLGCASAAVWHLYDPKPSVIISRDYFSCNWTVRWADVTRVSLQSGTKGKQYARIELAADTVGSGSGARKDCEITGLKTDYLTVYEAISAAWHNTQTKPADVSSAGHPDSLLRAYGLDQLPLGSRRHNVLAVLGPPTVSSPNREVLLYLRESAGGADPTRRRKGIAVYFDAQDRVERVAVYSAQNGKVVDEISHTPLSTGGFEFSILFVLLVRN
jgi:hypothetical protein